MQIIVDNRWLMAVSSLDIRPALISFAAYAIFIFGMVRVGITAAVDSYPRLNRAHHVFVLFMAALSFAFPFANTSRLFAVFFLYAFHRLYFLFFFGIARRSFSLNLMVTMAQRGSPIGAQELAAAYADGRGLASLAQSRMTALCREGLLGVDDSGSVLLTRKGRLMVLIRNFLLRAYNLKEACSD